MIHKLRWISALRLLGGMREVTQRPIVRLDLTAFLNLLHNMSALKAPQLGREQTFWPTIDTRRPNR